MRRKKTNNWRYAEGYIIGNRKHYADFIENKVKINSKDFNENGIAITDIETEGYFEKPRKKSQEIFLKPHILIKENIGIQNIPIELLDYDAVFGNEIIGIYAPDSDYNLLKKVYDSFISNNPVYRFYILATSSRVLIGRATAISKRDIDNLPIYRGLKSIPISDADQLVVKDVMTYYQRKGDEDKLQDKAETKTISEFSKIFCETLNSVYQNAKTFQLFKIIDSGKFFALHFEYSSEKLTPKPENAADLEEYIESVIPSWNEKTDNYRVQKIIKVYGQDSIILAKPKLLHYWLPSIALRDADETFAEYFKSRYQNA